MKLRRLIISVSCLSLIAGIAATQSMAKPNENSKKVFDYWTAERIQSAKPRDLVIHTNGLGYIKNKDGSFTPHGHDKLLQLDAQPKAKPSQQKGKPSGETTPPVITPIEPSDGAIVGASQRFAANVTDESGVKSVSIIITPPSGASQSFVANRSSGDTWETSISGFTNGSGWSWQIEATDNASRKGNTAVSPLYSFSVDTGAGGGGGGGGAGGDYVVTNSRWTEGGLIIQATGRLLYEMPTDRRLRRWSAYVCSGSVATDMASGRSVIITAAHCVYEDVYKAFARNVLFIPNQDGTTGSGTDSNCSNDPVGCWAPSFGVVDTDWTNRSFPDNIPWDYAYYVVNDTGAHTGASSSSDALDIAVGSIDINFTAPEVNDGDNSAISPDFTHGLGYSFSDDPFFMYCAEDMTTEGTDNWWLPSCGLSGGSSGGPWIQPLSNGTGPLMSVNSWGYTTSPGMAGPKLNGTSASCLFNEAIVTSFASVPTADGAAGIVSNCN